MNAVAKLNVRIQRQSHVTQLRHATRELHGLYYFFEKFEVRSQGFVIENLSVSRKDFYTRDYAYTLHIRQYYCDKRKWVRQFRM